jgi:hypothetical protein
VVAHTAKFALPVAVGVEQGTGVERVAAAGAEFVPVPGDVLRPAGGRFEAHLGQVFLAGHVVGAAVVIDA